MATRSFIGVADGTDVRYVYVHFDGYPSWMGHVLKTYYTDTDKINQLIDLGDLSSVYPKIGEHPMTRDEHHAHLMDDSIPESEQQCYARIRDDKIIQDSYYPKETTLCNFLYGDCDNMGAEWIYVFIEGEWTFAPRYISSKLGKHICNRNPLTKLTDTHIKRDSYGSVSDD